MPSEFDGSESWPEIYGGQQPNGQCDRKNVITRVFRCHFLQKIKIEDFVNFLINNYDDG